MSKVKKILKNRVLLTIFLVTTIWLSFTTMFTMSGQAAIYGYEDDYYTDPSHTDLCGHYDSCTRTTIWYSLPCIVGPIV